MSECAEQEALQVNLTLQGQGIMPFTGAQQDAFSAAFRQVLGNFSSDFAIRGYSTNADDTQVRPCLSETVQPC